MTPWIASDDGSPGLSPLCDLRAGFELRTGAVTTLERLTRRLGPPAALFVPEGLQRVVALRHAGPVNELPVGGSFTFINGRWTCIDRDPPAQINTAIVNEAGEVVAACLDRAHAERWPRLSDDVRRTVCDAKLLSRPWHVLDRCAANLLDDLAALGSRMTKLTAEPAIHVTVVGEHPVFIGLQTVVHPHTVFDTSAGPIVIDDGATVRSMAVMVGPGYVGRNSVVCNHAHIRAGTVIGPECKVGGEVNGCVFQGYSNKAHSGYLGNSFVGEWVNLGADTVTSNLKNTYGQVRVQTDPAGKPEPTGRQFLGSIIGDHVKTAIGTRLLTGTCLHTGAMVAVSSFPPKCVPPFAFLTDGGAERYDLEKFVGVASAMMSRRKVEMTPALRQRLAAIHSPTRNPKL